MRLSVTRGVYLDLTPSSPWNALRRRDKVLSSMTQKSHPRESVVLVATVEET